MQKQTSFVLLPEEGEAVAFSSNKEAKQQQDILKGSIYDVVIYTDDNLNTGGRPRA